MIDEHPIFNRYYRSCIRHDPLLKKRSQARALDRIVATVIQAITYAETQNRYIYAHNLEKTRMPDWLRRLDTQRGQELKAPEQYIDQAAKMVRKLLAENIIKFVDAGITQIPGKQIPEPAHYVLDLTHPFVDKGRAKFLEDMRQFKATYFPLI